MSAEDHSLQQLSEELDGLDVRYVAVIWSGAERPRIVNSCRTDFEAAGMLRAAAIRMEQECVDELDLEDEDTEENPDDEG